MSGILDGQIALVTGASRGIGRAIAERLARDGALVLINYLQSHAAAEEVVATITQAGGKAELARFDAANSSEITTAVQAILERHKKIDILVNCAGILRDRMIFNMSEEEWDEVVGQPGDYRLEGGDDVGEEPRRVVVAGVERYPGHRR